MGLIPPQIGEGLRKAKLLRRKRAPQMGLNPLQISEGRRTASVAADQLVPQNGTFSGKILNAI